MARGRKGLGVEPLAASIRFKFTLATGERVSETLPWPPTAPNLKRAHRMASDLRRDIDAGALTAERYREYFPESKRVAKPPTASTLGDYCDTFLRSIGDKSANTRGQYRNALRWWQKQLGRDTAIAEIRHSKVMEIWGSASWASWKLANNYLIPLRGVFALAGRDGALRIDPLEGVENKPRPPRDDPDPFTPAEQTAILRHLQDTAPPEVYDYFAFAFGTGMRPEEMIELRRTDVDWRLGLARVQRVRSAGEVRPPKNRKFRDVELNSLARAALERREAYAALVGAAPDAHLFLNPVTRKPWNSTASQRDHYWNPALKALGIRHRPAYNTRHTRASRLLMAECRTGWCAQQLGHSKEMFLRVYAKWLPDAAVRGEELAKEESSFRPDFVHEEADRGENLNEINEGIGRRDWTRTK